MLVVLLVAGVVAAWLAQRAVAQVTAASGVPQCERTEVTSFEWEMGSGFEQTAIPMRDGFVCTLTVLITNDSGRTVTLGRTMVPVAGPQGGAGFRVTYIDGQAVAGEDEVDAAVDLDQRLEVDRSYVIDFRVEFRKGGCTSPGGAIRVEPSIRVSSQLLSHDLTIADFPIFTGTPATNCDT